MCSQSGECIVNHQLYCRVHANPGVLDPHAFAGSLLANVEGGLQEVVWLVVASPSTSMEMATNQGNITLLKEPWRRESSNQHPESQHPDPPPWRNWRYAKLTASLLTNLRLFWVIWWFGFRGSARPDSWPATSGERLNHFCWNDSTPNHLSRAQGSTVRFLNPPKLWLAYSWWIIF